MYIQYNIIAQTTTVIIKLRSFNNLVDSLKDELLLKLSNFVKQKTTQAIASDPLAVTIMYIQATAQWYRRAARGPRDTVRKEEEKAHVGRKGEGKEAKIIRRLHFTMRNLDQDKLQLKFIIDIIRHLLSEHDRFYTIIKNSKSLDNRDWVFSKVDEELRRLDNHISYQVALIGDVANRADRLLSLVSAYHLCGSRASANCVYCRYSTSPRRITHAGTRGWHAKQCARTRPSKLSPYYQWCSSPALLYQ